MNDKPYFIIVIYDQLDVIYMNYVLCALRPPFKEKDLNEIYINVCKGKMERINKVYSNNLWKMILMLL